MTVVVSTPSRLHFGLLRFAQTAGPSFGGLGMMIDRPRWRLELSPADDWRADGQGADRALEFAKSVLRRLAPPDLPGGVHINIRDSIPAHRGFGGGTQLGLAIAAGLRRLAGMPDGSAEELAQLSGRGLRSAVGAHGFIHGGLIWEAGHMPDEPLSPLVRRVALPDSWRIVLIDAGEHSGLSGADEVAAFRTLPSPPTAIVDQLIHLAERVILPAATRDDFAAFSAGVHQYGRLAGECFAPIQGGAYASPRIARCIDVLLQLGCQGIGQSSWGPTVFAFAEDQQDALRLQATLANLPETTALATQISRPDNEGAKVMTAN